MTTDVCNHHCTPGTQLQAHYLDCSVWPWGTRLSFRATDDERVMQNTPSDAEYNNGLYKEFRRIKRRFKKVERRLALLEGKNCNE